MIVVYTLIDMKRNQLNAIFWTVEDAKNFCPKIRWKQIHEDIWEGYNKKGKRRYEIVCWFVLGEPTDSGGQ